MAKYGDRKSLGRSDLVPFKRNESYRMRHERRKNHAIVNQGEIREWCKDNSWIFRIKNNGHHFIFTKGKIVFDWFPSTAKLVKNKKWKNGMHCHDFKKVIKQMKTIP